MGFCETSLTNDMLTRHLNSELQYFLVIFIDAASRLWLPNRSRATAGRKFCGAYFHKVRRNPKCLMVLTSKSVSSHSGEPILRTWASKRVPTPPVFNDFDFQIALAPQRGANFGDVLGSRSSATPVLGADFPSRRSHKTIEKHSISRNSDPPKPPHLTHLSCITSTRSWSSAATLSIAGS